MLLLQSAILAAFAASPVAAYTLHSVIVFTRHGDRTAKYFKGYQMTNLGAQEVFSSGQFYRSEYLTNQFRSIRGISSDAAVPSQLWASAPDQSVLFQTATNFLQGLYPPLGQINPTLSTEELVNGTAVQDPLNGYQFVLVHGEGDSDPDTIWLKGDDNCPTYTNASEKYADTYEYQNTFNITKSFYSQFEDLLAPIMGADRVSYAEAYDVFDLLNVASIHNSSIAANISASDLDQLRWLANEWEWNHNYNIYAADRSTGGMAFAGGLLRQMDKIVKGKAALKFNLMAGSYDTFMSFFGITNMTAISDDFRGLPNYAATMAFELFSDDGDQYDGSFPADPSTGLQVRFLFRNGTDESEPLQAYPLFGAQQDQTNMTYGSFVKALRQVAINNTAEWCTICQSEQDFCAAALQSDSSEGGSGLSNAAAGGIGAAVTLVVVALLGAIAFALLRRKNAAKANQPAAEKSVRASDSESA